MSLTRQQLDAINRMDEIAACWRAISNLLAPECDIRDPQSRDDMALLTNFLNTEYEAARAGLEQPREQRQAAA